MDEAPTLISPAERNRRLARLVTAAQRALEAVENPVARVWPDKHEVGEFQQCYTPSGEKGLLTVVNGEALAKELREGLVPFNTGAPEPVTRTPPPPHPTPTSSIALAHLSTLTVPRAIKPYDTVRLLQKDSYRGLKVGELGKVSKVCPDGRWIDVRWRRHPAHDLTMHALHVELVVEV